MVEKNETINIGLNVKTPKKKCTDQNCPFHGILSVRGQIITGVVSSIKMQTSILVKREYMLLFQSMKDMKKEHHHMLHIALLV